MIKNPKDTMKILPIQEEYKQEYKSFDRDSIWYTDRPINARTQTYNRYLDWCKAVVTQSIPTFTSTKITWYSFNITGNYKFDSVSDAITIPTDWTYNITINYKYAWSTTLDTIYEVLLNGDLLYQTTRNWTSAWETIQIVWVENFKKWDKIEIYVVKIDSWNLNIDVSSSIIKLS